MPAEVQDLILKRLDTLDADVRSLREQMRKEHAELKETVIKLQHSERITRWIWAACGAGVMYAIRELVTRLL